MNKKVREKIAGGYREVEMNYDAEDNKTEEKTETNGNGDKKKDDQT